MTNEHQNPLTEAVVTILLFAGSMAALNYLYKVIVKVVFTIVMQMGDKLL